MRPGRRIALYAGSFDPPTNGHLAVIRAAGRLCDTLVLAVGVHPSKTPMLSVDVRLDLLRRVAEHALRDSGCAVEVRTAEGLTVDLARSVGASLILRGLRGATDLDDEMSMAGMNGEMAPEVQTLFVPATPGTRHITATLVRQIAAMGGDVSAFVPSAVVDALQVERIG